MFRIRHILFARAIDETIEQIPDTPELIPRICLYAINTILSICAKYFYFVNCDNESKLIIHLWTNTTTS